MPDAGPPDPRTYPPMQGDERATLSGFLTFQRPTLAWKCADLSADDLARRSISCSTMSLLGLVRHMAEVERIWFRDVLSAEKTTPYFYDDADRDGEFNRVEADGAQVESGFAAWKAEIAFADEFVANAPNLDVVGTNRHGETMSLRWVLVHMIEEYARHNGHADLMRQAIDGAVGE